MAVRDISDLESVRNVLVKSVDLDVSERVNKAFSSLLPDRSDDSAFKHDGDVFNRAVHLDCSFLGSHSDVRESGDKLVGIEGVVHAGDGNAAHGDMVEESARSTIWGVDWAQESPSFRKKLSHCGGLLLSEVLSSMDRSEVTQESDIVELISDDGVS